MELYKEKFSNGSVITSNVEIKNYKNKLAVYFVKSAYSDKNKWKESQVLTDVEVSIIQLSGIYRNSDTTGSKLLEYIKNNYHSNADLIRNVAKLSEKTDKIYIGLPTSTTLFGDTRAFKDTFRPLIVTFNDEDVSRFFQDFDIFGSRAVNVAYDALINRKIPSSNNDLVSFCEIDLLHNKICGSLNILEK